MGGHFHRGVPHPVPPTIICSQSVIADFSPRLRTLKDEATLVSENYWEIIVLEIGTE
jgi:hypothetical protein